MKLRDKFSTAARLAWVVVLLVCVAACPQWARAQSGDEEVVRVESSLVRLNVGVVDTKGRPVTDLARGDFVVYEDGVRQPVMSFEPTQSPFSLVLLLDVSGSTINFRQTLKQSALRFIDALGPDDRVAVVAFNERRKLLTKFTPDRNKIAWGIESAEGRGGTNLYDALGYALQQLAAEGSRRKAIIVLTDGLDTEMRNLDRAAAADARTDDEALATVKPEASKPLNRVLDAADRQGVTIYPLILPSGDPKSLAFHTPQITAIYGAARVRVQTLADRTGGRLSEIRRLEDLGRLYAEVAADMRTLYSLAYQPVAGRGRDGRWRSIRIEVSRAELLARTRPGYFAR
jgi:VWFA-related protein